MADLAYWEAYQMSWSNRWWRPTRRRAWASICWSLSYGAWGAPLPEHDLAYLAPSRLQEPRPAPPERLSCPLGVGSAKALLPHPGPKGA